MDELDEATGEAEAEQGESTFLLRFPFAMNARAGDYTQPLHTEPQEKPKRKRGRPRGSKNKKPADAAAAASSSNEPPPQKRGRGRPPKVSDSLGNMSVYKTITTLIQHIAEA